MALNSLLCADVPLSTYTLTRYDAANSPPYRSTSCRPVWLRKHIWRAEVSRVFHSATSTALSSTWKALIHRLGDLVCTNVRAHCQSPEPVSPHAADMTGLCVPLISADRNLTSWLPLWQSFVNSVIMKYIDQFWAQLADYSYKLLSVCVCLSGC